MILLILLAAWIVLLERQLSMRHAVALGCAVSAAVLVKYIAALPLAYLMWSKRDRFTRKTCCAAAATAIAFGTLLTLPFLDASQPGFAVFNSLGTYLTHWRFNDSVFHIIGALYEVDWNDARSFVRIKYLLAGIWLIWCGWLFWRGRHWMESSLAALVLLLLCSPVVHPWYGLWLAAFLAHHRSYAGRYLCLTLPFSYAALLSGSVDVPLWIKCIEYGPVPILLIKDHIEIQAQC